MTDVKDLIDTVIQGDCRIVMRTLPSNSVDTIITDPPYGLGFMNKEWDNPDKERELIEREIRRSEQRFKEGKSPTTAPFTHCVRPGLGIKKVNNEWFQKWVQEWAVELLRVAKPGAILLTFGGTRTFHRLACGIEDAGWEIRDTLMWLYGSGFPKSLNISKAIDKRRSTDIELFAKYIKEKRETASISLKELNIIFGYVAGCNWWESKGDNFRYPNWEDYQRLKSILDLDNRYDDYLRVNIGEKIGETVRGNAGFSNEQVPRPWKQKIGESLDITAPATPEAQLWEGWGTSLKPAYEPIIMAMKPLDGTYAENALKWGVSGLNIDGGRIGTLQNEPNARKAKTIKDKLGGVTSYKTLGTGNSWNGSLGRFPANLLLDEVSAEMLDEQSGISKSSGGKGIKSIQSKLNTSSIGCNSLTNLGGLGDIGGASRFFYVAKASKSERNAGLEGNNHPTVKPLKLMEYLVKLTKMPNPNQVYLDPFAGSGSTLIAVLNNDRHFIGIEKEPDYVEIAKARIKYWNSRKDKTLDFGDSND